MLLFWILFNFFIVAMLALDLGVLNRRAHTVELREALGWSAAWIVLAAAFAFVLFCWHGRAEALQFVTGYVIELSLSVDNLFLFLVIFRYFEVPPEHQHRVLFWGVLGALVMRGLFIATGVSLMLRFAWVTYVFGALLVYSGLKLFRQRKQKIDPDRNPVLRVFRHILPITSEYKGGKFFVRKDAFYATPLFVVLLVVETSDILNAVDSVPAVLAITLNAFVVYTSNVFAILGLRSVYFALAQMMDRFHYLHYGLSVVLILIGLKMIGSHYVRVPTEWMLGTVAAILTMSVVASLIASKHTLS